MKKIILHMGHHKTGSSAIQACLASNVELLNEFGIDYPDHHSFTMAQMGYSTSGNLNRPVKSPSSWLEEQVLPRAANGKFETLLYSSESIFGSLLPNLETIAQLKDTYKFELILFVCNPIEMIKSLYLQSIKEGRNYRSIQEFGWQRQSLKNAAKIVRKCVELDIDIKIRNYSCCKNTLIQVFSKLLDPDGELELVYDLPGTVNRSLSRFEFELQKKINEECRHLGRQSLSHMLVNELPDIKGTLLYVDEETRQISIARQGDSLNYINGFLAADEQLTFEDPGDLSDKPDKEYSVTPEQITIVAKYMADQLRIQKGIIFEKRNETILQIYGKRLFVFNPRRFKNSLLKRMKWMKF